MRSRLLIPQGEAVLRADYSLVKISVNPHQLRWQPFVVAFYIHRLLIKRIPPGDSNDNEFRFQQYKLETHHTHFAFELIHLDS